MGEIQEVFEDIKDKIGDKGFLIFIGVAVIIFIYNLSKGSEGSSSSEVSSVVVSASYPDAVTNADVIISTLQDSIEYSEGEIKEEIQGLGTELNDYLQANFEATNDYINTGFESQEILMHENFDSIGESLMGIGEDIGNIQSNVSGLQSNVSGLQNTVNNMKNQLNNKITTTTSTTSGKNTTSNVSYYTYQTKSGLNTNTSIVDALKAIGVDSSMTNRTRIAQANGINNYTGSYSQNVTLLGKLKRGQLVKV